MSDMSGAPQHRCRLFFQNGKWVFTDALPSFLTLEKFVLKTSKNN